MSEVPYKSCVSCGEVVLAEELEGHIRDNHRQFVDSIVDRYSLAEADVITGLIDDCQDSLQGPIREVGEEILPIDTSTYSSRLGLSDSFGNHVDVMPGTGQALTPEEVDLVVRSLRPITGFAVNSDSFASQMAKFLVMTDASNQNMEGTVTLKAQPNVGRQPPGAAVKLTRTVRVSEIQTAGENALKSSGRTFTLRRLGRALYPMIYRYKDQAVFKDLNATGNGRTQAWGWSPHEWYLTVSFVYGAPLTRAEHQRTVEAARLIGPVDAVEENKVESAAPQSIADAKARATMNAFSAAGHRTTGSVGYQPLVQ